MTTLLSLLFFGIILKSTALSAQIDLHSDKGNQYFMFFNQQLGISLLDSEVDRNIESVKDLLNRAHFKMLYGMDLEAKVDIEKALSINPYAVYLTGFYGTEGVLSVLESQPKKSLLELSKTERLDYYDTVLAKESSVYELDSLQTNQLKEVLSLMRKNDLKAASKKLEPHLVESSNIPMANDLKSILLEISGDEDQAKNILLKSIERYPSYPLAYFNLGRLEKQLGNLEKANAYYNTAIFLSTDLNKAYFERAMLQKMVGNYEKAEADYSTIIETDMELSDQALINRGLTRKLLGDYDGAIEDLSKAIELYPKNEELYKNRANIYLLLGKINLAIDGYSKAILINSEYAEAYYNRALAHYLNNDKENACNDLNVSSSLFFDKAVYKKPFFCDGN